MLTMDFNKEQTASVAIDRCVFLGLEEDPQTAIGFPSIWNFCHKARPAASVSLSFQRSTCQVAAHLECPLRKNDGVRRLPPEARSSAFNSSERLRGKRLGLIILLLALAAGGLLLIWMVSTGIIQMRMTPDQVILSPTGPGSPVQSVASVAAPPESSVTTFTSPVDVPETDPVVSLSPSLNAAMCGYQLDQVILAERQFIIHRARGGENLNQYASDYETSVEAILAANQKLPVPLHIDWVLVIPVGTSDLGGLPSYEPYFESAGATGLADMAESLSVDESVLRKSNGFAKECQTVSGWLLVPRPPDL